MAHMALVLLGLFALLFVVSEVAATSKGQSVKSESYYGGEGYGHGPGGGYIGGGNRGHYPPLGEYNGGGGYNGGGEAVQTQPGH
ncbi:unnamed protein product [Eruca vesicaria subsp. sativa]|uniref:Glycine-rich protein n=1 Tax=Eruca vesicaria subsp. sativa TaxID=29727 RepID=A0ABC8LYJ3_ERUVS|nr:unnamed protein product [Eruca vesicaria subsp. sativa]